MLSSGLIEGLGDLRPILLLIPSNVLENDQILLLRPINLANARVEVVLPALSALFGSLEKFPTRLLVKLFGNFVPLAQFEIPT